MSSLLVAPPSVEAAAPSAAPPSPAVAPDAASAAAQAKRSGQRVEVASARTELTQVFANPSGGFTAESAVVPQRVRRADGSWADIDLSLRPAAGVLRPVAAVADVRFSAGGKGPAVTLVRQGKSLTLSWPGGLPKPTVSGDSATYPEVLPGADLVLRATRTGFTHVFAVKTAQAAANPALRTLRFDLGGDARVVRGPDGGLTAVAGTEVLAKAEPAVMWDSNTTPTPAAHPAADGESHGGGRPSRSTAAAPGDVAKTAAVGVEVAGGELVLRPDTALLSRAAAYPVFIDPAWSTGKSRWAYATNNNTNNTDTSVARVGRDPDSGKIYRSYFDFPLSSMKGKHIESAYVQMKLDHSWSCDNTPTYMYHSAGISTTPRTTWAPKLNSLKSSAQSHANEGYGCADSPQPDMTVNFTGSGVTGIVQSHATSGLGNITFGFCACSATDGTGESTTDRWKKWFPDNAKLVVDYDSIPGAPNNLQVAGVACTPGGALPVGTLTPTFSAIFPDADTGQSLATAYEWVQVPSSGVIDSTTPRKTAPAGASVPANGRSTTAAVSGMAQNVTYAFRAKATDPAPYSLTSTWSDWCRFKVDTTVPPVTISAKSGGTPGTLASFTLMSTDSNVRKFRYGWSSPTTEVGALVRWNPDGTVAYVMATVRVTVPKYGRNIFYASAIDTAGNIGTTSTEIIAGRPNPAVARWGLESYPGVYPAPTEDSQPALAGNTPLTQTNVTWSNDVHLVGGQTATFNGSSTALTTSGPVIDTSRSFSVAGWVRLTALPTADDSVMAAQEGVNAAGFHLGTRLIGSPATPRWSFLMKDSDLQSSTTRAAYSSTALTSADVNRWTHLAGVYDADAAKLRLYVNGVLAAEIDRPVELPWSAGGNFVAGRGFSFGAPGNFWKGNIADLQVYDRVLVPHDFTGQLASDPDSGGFDEPGMLQPVQVGQWLFEGATPCYEVSTDPSLCSAPEAGQFGRRLALTQGTNVGNGNRDTGLQFDDRHFVEDPADPYYGLATREYGRSQDNTGEPQNPVWQDGRVLRTDQSFTVSVWVQPSAIGGSQTAVAQRGLKQSSFYLGQTATTVNGATEIIWTFNVYGVDSDVVNGNNRNVVFQTPVTDETTSAWTHLVGVYDVARREVRLYVNGDLKSTVPFGTFAGAFDATGSLTVGGALYTSSGGTPAMTNRWFGGVDDLRLYQGALTDAAVKTLSDSESSQTVTLVE
ncbi:LamG domain-containing protein [Micromonospora sp. NPDC048930]|uniref:LamG domain-containing protein n=1 Tax=Micromonospora sp. NPDC048930 TaxID=3364261 RepID=UPI00371A4BC9